MLAIRVTEGQGHRSCPASARNLSKGGIGASIPAEYAGFAALLAPGREVSLEIRWPDGSDPLAVKATVVWIGPGSQGQYLAGFQFIELCQEAQEQVERRVISQIIRRHTEEEGDE